MGSQSEGKKVERGSTWDKVLNIDRQIQGSGVGTCQRCALEIKIGGGNGGGAW